jgi:hypothetical protein
MKRPLSALRAHAPACARTVASAQDNAFDRLRWKKQPVTLQPGSNTATLRYLMERPFPGWRDCRAAAKTAVMVPRSHQPPEEASDAAQ